MAEPIMKGLAYTMGSDAKAGDIVVVDPASGMLIKRPPPQTTFELDPDATSQRPLGGIDVDPANRTVTLRVLHHGEWAESSCSIDRFMEMVEEITGFVARLP